MSKLFALKSIRMLIVSLSLLAVLAVGSGTTQLFGGHIVHEAHAASSMPSTSCYSFDKWAASLGWQHYNQLSLCSDGSRIWQNGGGPNCNLYYWPPFSITNVT